MKGGGLGQGEIDDHVGGSKKGLGIVAHHQSQGARADKDAEIGSDRRRAGDLGSSGQRAALGLQDRLDQHAPHAPGAADDSDFHGFPPLCRPLPRPF